VPEASAFSEIQVTKPAQQQQQQQPASQQGEYTSSAADPAAGIAAESILQPVAGCTADAGSSSSSSSDSAQHNDWRQQQEQQVTMIGASSRSSRSQVHFQLGPSGCCDAAASSAAAAQQTNQHINEHIHRSTGETNGFALVPTPAADSAAAAADGKRSSKETVSSSLLSSSRTFEGSQAGRDISSHQQRQQQTRLPPLQTTSITLAVLAQRNDAHEAGSTSSLSSTRGCPVAAAASGSLQGDLRNTSSKQQGPASFTLKSGATHGLHARKLRLLAKRPPTPQQVLATAGIKGSSRDWEQLLTPLSWKLYQQQRDAARQKQQQLVGRGGMSSRATALARSSEPDFGEAAGSSSSSSSNMGGSASPFANAPPDASAPANASSSSSSSSSTAASTVVASNARALRFASRATGPHRRSFELPGASAGMRMSAVFGANKQHVSRMLREAGTIDPRGLYRMLSRGQGSLAVATSLAGALPGCVSEKLVQFVDVSSSLSGAAVGVGPGGSSAAAAAAAATSSRFQDSTALVTIADVSNIVSNSVSDNCGSVEGDVCAVCADKVPNVALAGCGHALCCDCTRTIVGEGVGSRPPLCPFCRQAITGFAVVVPAAAM
jgi:hypothetical protein